MKLYVKNNPPEFPEPDSRTPYHWYKTPDKMFSVTKMITFLLLVILLQVPARAAAQTITLTAKNESLKSVLKKVAKQAGFYVVYEESEVQNMAPVTLEVKAVTLKEALDACFKNQPLIYEVMNKTVVVKRKKKT